MPVYMRRRRVDWPSLLPELLRDISLKLASVFEFVRFRAVCKPWRSAVDPADLPPQLPWLMLPFDDSNTNTDAYTFYSQETGRKHILHLPEFRGKRICGTSDGWVVLAAEDDGLFLLSLVQPLIRSHISLPPLQLEWDGYLSARLWACLSSNPTTFGCTVVAWNNMELHCCQLGHDRKWSQWRIIRPKMYAIEVVLSRRDNKLYVSDGISSVGIHAGTETTIIRHPKKDGWRRAFSHLIETSGELLLAVHFTSYVNQYEFYRLDESTPEDPRWVKLGDTDHQRMVHFVGLCQSFSISVSKYTTSTSVCNAAFHGIITEYRLRDGGFAEKNCVVTMRNFKSGQCSFWFVPRLL